MKWEGQEPWKSRGGTESILRAEGRGLPGGGDLKDGQELTRGKTEEGENNRQRTHCPGARGNGASEMISGASRWNPASWHCGEMRRGGWAQVTERLGGAGRSQIVTSSAMGSCGTVFHRSVMWPGRT